MATEDLELEQLDVKTKFLHRDVEEDIYMSQPAGLSATWEKSLLVCRLKKSFYGLKQALRMWYQKFDSYIRELVLCTHNVGEGRSLIFTLVKGMFTIIKKGTNDWIE